MVCFMLRAAAAHNMPIARRFLHDDRDGQDINGREAPAAAPPVEEVRPSAVEAQHWGDYRVDQFGGEQPRRGPQRSQRRAPQRGQTHAGSMSMNVFVPSLFTDTGSHRAAEETSETASVGYQYLDPQGVVRGPFPAAKVGADGPA